MNRQVTLLSALGGVLLVVAFYFFAWAPQNDRIDEIELEIQSTLALQATASRGIATLQAVRAEAPSREADIGAAEAVIPRETALAGMVRQLQLAADDAGVTLLNLSPGRPASVGDPEAEGLASIDISLSLTGSYFQVVDFLRRVEDPAITPRAILWNSAALGPTDYPELSVSLSGQMFAILPPIPPAAPAEPEPTPSPTDPDADPDATETEGGDGA